MLILGHGCGIARRTRESSGHTPRVLGGAPYTALHRLEERGAVESEWGHTEQGKRARICRLTAASRRDLRAATAQWERDAAGMAGVLSALTRPT